jgi:hypothetical protein
VPVYSFPKPAMVVGQHQNFLPVSWDGIMILDMGKEAFSKCLLNYYLINKSECVSVCMWVCSRLTL